MRLWQPGHCFVSFFIASALATLFGSHVCSALLINPIHSLHSLQAYVSHIPHLYCVDNIPLQLTAGQDMKNSFFSSFSAILPVLIVYASRAAMLNSVASLSASAFLAIHCTRMASATRSWVCHALCLSAAGIVSASLLSSISQSNFSRWGR